MGANVVHPASCVRDISFSRDHPPVTPSTSLEQQIRLQIIASYRGQAAEQWLRACLKCLRRLRVRRS